MILEEVLEQAAYARPGFSLVAFKEGALPLYLLSTRLLTLEKKPLGPIEEACLGSIDAGLNNPDEIADFLGLSRQVLNGILASLNITECINYSRATELSEAIVTLNEKGRSALSSLKQTTPVESVVKLIFDPFERKVRFIPLVMLSRPREVKEHGWYEVPLCGAKRPEIEDVPLAEIDKALQKNPRKDGVSRELLALRRIERREMHFLPCILLYYRSITTDEVQVAFFLDEGFSLAHETIFRKMGGPELVGAKHALSPPDMPQMQGILGSSSDPEHLQKLIKLEQEVSAEHACASAENKILVNAKAETLLENAPVSKPDGKALTLLRAMTQRCIRCHEHPALLRKALTTTQKRLLIVSPWITHYVVDKNFLYSIEALLRNGVKVTIGYGLADEDGGKNYDKAKQKPPITFQAERDLKDIEKRFENFSVVFLGNTHRKLLVSDQKFAVVTSFNWLSFRGDPGKQARDEFGFQVTDPLAIEGIYQDGLGLVQEGYTHPQ